MAAGWVYLAALEDIPEGESRGFDPLGIGRDSLFVVRRDATTFLAYRNACPHIQGARMAWKKDHFLSSDGRYITCFAHGALFRVWDGHCVSGPCLGDKLVSLDLKICSHKIYVWLEDLVG
ncbi:Rieske (2Fe-2S) protein [Halomonas sp. V046]|uniref:Rieske (2Fe-2S) protein n=1 Tax=Halomonas sp. V046 TaxID=3459611 RepID=UPI00404481D1